VVAGWLSRDLRRARSPWAQAANSLLVFGPMVVCLVAVFRLPPAFFLAAAITPIEPLIVHRSFLRLSKQDRAIVEHVLMTGRASGRPELDELARDRLARASQAFPGRGGWPRRLRVVIIGVLPVILAIIAAVVSSPWWLLMMLCTPAMFYPVWRRSLPDAGPRLLLLLADLD
jgi:hypothetical protein